MRDGKRVDLASRQNSLRSRTPGLTVLLWAGIWGGLAGPALARETPGLGVPLSAAEIAAIDISIFPDGAGLPPGTGHVSDGQAPYEAKGASCHGSKGAGGTADELAGGEHGLRGDPPDKVIGTYWPYATTLFDYIRRSMPIGAPRSLTDEQVYAVTA
jgi:cytochrome c